MNAYSGLVASYRESAFNPKPVGAVRLPHTAVALRNKLDDAWEKSVMSGYSTEDDSAGFALANDPRTRAAQLPFSEYALRSLGPRAWTRRCSPHCARLAARLA